MKFGDLTYQEIKQRAEAGALAVVPTGCTEQQGPHLPVDFDTWFSESVCLSVADYLQRKYHIDTVVLPPLPFGPTPEHRGFGSGYIDLPYSLHQAVVDAILTSLAAQGFRRLIVWRGCGGHRLDEVVNVFNHSHEGHAKAFLPDHHFHEMWCKLGNPADPGGHADSFTTALAMYLRPSCVRMDKIVDPQSRPVDWSDPHLDFTQYSSTGVIGTPMYAEEGLGRELWQAVVEQVAEIFKAISETR